ncbi:MAG TPA: GNAT family N-acetyltransferase [Burkholderiales bacterium]
MKPIAVRVGDDPQIEAWLAERMYEYNAAATGYHDAESFTAVQADGTGAIEAGISGYTWGGCCFVTYLWVFETLRGKGLGSELLGAAERHACEKGCSVILVSSHSFQAPWFYARRGYERVARLEDHPVGHSSSFYTKRLDVLLHSARSRTVR